MSGLKLTIILPTKHRISVKVSSKETLIRQVLEDACDKKKLDPDAHRLQRNNKVLTLYYTYIIYIIPILNTLSFN